MQLFLFFSLIMATQVGLASVKASYARLSPLVSDPGNEITQDDAAFDYSQSVYQTENKLNFFSTGLSLQSTQLGFDGSRIGTVRLFKAMVPISATHVHSAETIVSWTLNPGLHGEHGGVSDAEFRLQGQLTFVLPRVGKQWVLGVVYGEQFGKPQIAPLIGANWQLSDRSQLSTLFPLLKYEYRAESEIKYNIALQPVGAQWTWKRGDVANNTEPGNIELSGSQFSGGASAQLSEKISGFFALGIVTNRKFKITRQADPSINASVNLKDSWTAQAGVEFP